MKQKVGDRGNYNRNNCCEAGWTGVTVVSSAGEALTRSSLSLTLGHELSARNKSVSWIVATFSGLLELLRIVDFTVKLHTVVDVSWAYLCEDTWNTVLHEAGGGFGC